MNFKIADSKFRELLLPTLLIVMALNISAVIDSFFIGTFVGKSGVAAVEILEPVILIMVVLEWLFGLGGQILSLNKKAEFDEEGSNRYFTVAIITTLIVTALITIFCLLNADTLFTLLRPPASVLPYVKDYSFFLFLSFVVSTLAGVITQYIRVDGEPNFASAIIIVANVINIVLDYIFLSVFSMGMNGAAMATFIGYTLSMFMLIIYIRNPKRTFRFIHSKIPIKQWLQTTWEIIKVGFPGASIGFFDFFLILFINYFLSANLGEVGLTTYVVCVDAYVIISIVIVGISETLTSIVPVYYAKHDYLNLNHLIRMSLIVTYAASIIFTAFILIWPEGFLMLYNFDQSDIAPFVINALRVYSFIFIFGVLPELLVFYYEAIERTVLSTVLSLMLTFAAPLGLAFSLYYLIGTDGIWIAFPLGAILSTVIVIIIVKVIESRETQYSGIFFIEKDLIPKIRNYLISSNPSSRDEMHKHLKEINASESFCRDIDELLDGIFKTKGDDTNLEVLLIDYDDNIHLDIKYDGEKEDMDVLKEEFKNKDFKYAEVLGFSNIEYVMDKS